MKIKVKFEQTTTISVLDKVTAKTVSSHFERITTVSGFFYLTVAEVLKYFNASDMVKENTKFGFTDCWGHCTYQYNTIEELTTATESYLKTMDKEIEFKAEFFNNRVTLQPLEKTEEELKAHGELIRSFGE